MDVVREGRLSNKIESGNEEERTDKLTSCNSPLILISMSSIIFPVFEICEVVSCTGRSCSDYPLQQRDFSSQWKVNRRSVW